MRQANITTTTIYLQVLQPYADALNALIPIEHVPHQHKEGSVSEETLVSQVVLLLHNS